MRTHTNNFKNELTTFGREFDYKITHNNSVISMENIVSINYNVKGDILKSVMQELKVDLKNAIPKGDIINFQIGLRVGNSFEYLDYGDFIVEKIEKQEDKKSYLLTCYDKMLLTMVDYESIRVYTATTDNTFIDEKKYYEYSDNEYVIYEGERTGNPSSLGLFEDTTYPVTIREYINRICNHLGITFANASDTFINYDNLINNELYVDEQGNSLGYTFRTVLDEIAEATGSIIRINKDNELELKYITQTNDTINEYYFNDTNVNVGKKYGPINSLVFSRSADSDSIIRKDDESISLNGLFELKVSDNQILNNNDRDLYIDNLFNYIKGTNYYLNDYDTKGILYYEIGDMYNVSIFNNTYNCLLLNTEVNIFGSLKETIYTNEPLKSETEHKATSDTDKKINQTYLIVNKQEGTITGLISKTDTIEMTATEASNLANQASNTAIEANTKANSVDEDLQEYKQTVSTQFTQTNQDFTFQFNNITDLVNQVSNTESGHYSELHRYIRFINGVIILGEEGSPFTVELSNTRLSFKENGTEVAYVSNNKLNITFADIKTQLDLGNFQFKPRDNGSLSFGKKG